MRAVAIALVWITTCLVATSCATGGQTDIEGTQTPIIETGGCKTAGVLFTCNGDKATPCDADAGTSVDCAADGRKCHPGFGCVVCTPGEGTCSNGNATVCRPDGSEMVDYKCDPVQGMRCEPDGCKGACSWAALGPSYIGCEYWPTVTENNAVWKGFTFAIVLTNTGTASAEVLVTQGQTEIKKLMLAPGKLEVIELPWVKELKGPDPNFMGQPSDPGPSVLAANGAYRVRSTQPVTVYQFNPLDYKLAPKPAECPYGDPKDPSACYSYSNDASLLLPTHVLTRDYYAMTWPSQGCKPAFITITATQDDTEVKLDPGARQFVKGGGIDSNGEGSATLQAGDVLQVLAGMTGGGFCFNTLGSDPTGARVRASKPVHVITGQACANIPTVDTQACDHVEDVMFPVETLGKDYLVAFPVAPNGKPSPHTLRIAAVEKDTKIHFDPPEQEDVVLSPSDPTLELRYVKKDLRITADKPILIAQFMQGADTTPGNDPDGGLLAMQGDPSQALAVPTRQFRNDYVFLAPNQYDKNFVNVIAKLDAVVTVDGKTIDAGDFQPIGESGYGVARELLSQTDVHTAKSAVPFGIMIYGYGSYTSYMYPGGLDLGHISVAPAH
ncbi:MAG: IgGFc-binding protein [Deltaproteobacteria bacterium]|nr:IgGFc-binding protein [Deltaproteobacteria bacterium]